MTNRILEYTRPNHQTSLHARSQSICTIVLTCLCSYVHCTYKLAPTHSQLSPAFLGDFAWSLNILSLENKPDVNAVLVMLVSIPMSVTYTYNYRRHTGIMLKGASLAHVFACDILVVPGKSMHGMPSPPMEARTVSYVAVI